MEGQTPFEKFKDKEFKGDLLLKLIVCDILLDRGVQRTDVSRFSQRYTSNEHLATVFDALELRYQPDDISHESTQKPFKRKGNTVEYHFWRFFMKNGYTKTKNYFKPFVAWPRS